MKRKVDSDWKKIQALTSIPFSGGVDTYREKALLALGGFSALQNLRSRHPGLEQRLGMTYHHSTAYSTTMFLRYKQGRGSFSVGDSVVGSPSGSTATVASVYDLGNNVGLLGLSSVTGTFNGSDEVVYVVNDYGSDLLTDGDCSSDSFTKQTGWSYDAGNQEYDCDGSQTTYSSIYQSDIGLTSGLYYIQSATYSNISAGACYLGLAGNTFTSVADPGANGTYTLVQQATSTDIAYFGGDSDLVGTLDDLSTKLVNNAALCDGASINYPHSLYQFSKGKRVERHFFAQMRDGALLEATDNPPTVTTGAFGSNVFSGSVNDNCASYANINDIMIYSNGVDQHKLYAGTYNPVLAFMKYDGSGAPGDFPTEYIDYTRKVTDGDSSTVAVLDSLDTYANNECVFIATPIPANRLTWTVSAANANSATGTLSYRKSDNTWADTTETDGTASGGVPLFQSGSMTWTHPSDEIPTFLFGISAYWYRWETSAQLDAEVEISQVTYGSGLTSLTNVWDGYKEFIIEAVFVDDSASVNYTFSGDNVTLDSMTTSDSLYVSSKDPLEAIYIDVGGSPNTETTTTIADVQYWNGSALTSYTETDYTNGLNNSGWIVLGRLSSGTQQKTRVDGSDIEAYWYKITIGTATTSTMNVGIYGMPYFDIADFGKGGTSSTWKDRAVYSFDEYPSYLYVTPKNRPNVLNGEDSAILQAGDGRFNRIVCMIRFHNELLVYQEERGKEGGCMTYFAGYTPSTFGRSVLSDKLGTFSSKSVVLVDGVMTSTETEQKPKKMAYSISHCGIVECEGLEPNIISDGIGNYFDPSSSDCIRRGYESEMWIGYDSSENVLRIGLVSGSSATTCNVFPVFDLTDREWSFDVFGQNLSCMTEVEAESGDVSILQYAGGTDDGAVYRLNTGTDDIDIGTTTTAITSSCTLEFSTSALIISIRKFLLRTKTQSAGNCTMTMYRNSIAKSETIDVSMVAENSGETSKRKIEGLDLKGDQLSINLSNSTAGQSMYLLDYAVEIHAKEGR